LTRTTTPHTWTGTGTFTPTPPGGSGAGGEVTGGLGGSGGFGLRGGTRPIGPPPLGGLSEPPPPGTGVVSKLGDPPRFVGRGRSPSSFNTFGWRFTSSRNTKAILRWHESDLGRLHGSTVSRSTTRTRSRVSLSSEKLYANAPADSTRTITNVQTAPFMVRTPPQRPPEPNRRRPSRELCGSTSSGRSPCPTARGGRARR
jgi:hypothetical protein